MASWERLYTSWKIAVSGAAEQREIIFWLIAGAPVKRVERGASLFFDSHELREVGFLGRAQFIYILENVTDRQSSLTWLGTF
jgi:hypothetical protein